MRSRLAAAAATLAVTAGSACEAPTAPTAPRDPLGDVARMSTHAVARSFALFDGARVAVAREHLSDVLLASVEPGAAALDVAVDVGIGPRSVATCTRGAERVIVTADTTGSSLTVLSDRSGAFALAATLAWPGIPRSVRCLDAPAGGDVTLVVAEGVGEEDGRVVVLTVAPDGSFAERAARADPGVSVAEPLALLADGTIEIAAIETRYGTVSTFEAGGRDDATRVFAPCADPSSAALADIDGIDPLDLVVACHDGTLAIITDRTAPSPKVRPIPVGGDFYALVALDLNADGRADLAMADEANHRAVVLMGLGGGAFAEPSPHPVPRGPVDLHAGDLDADGDPDLVVLSYEEPSLGWLLNDTRP
ncbi:MAG: VCBS repeat-containing protein [Polyangiaceae bacterium]